MLSEADIPCLSDHSELAECYAQWPHSKWGVPTQTYPGSIDAARKSPSSVPAWYAILDDDKNIMARLGVIENDFHKRPDLAPNMCAVYAEEAWHR